MTVATSPEGAPPNSPAVSLAPAIPPEELDRLTDDIIAALKTVYDPEIPVNVFELGLIYTVDLDDTNFADVKMTLTAPNCPAAGHLPMEAETKVNAVEGNTFDITLTTKLSGFENVFKMFPFSRKYGGVDVAPSEGTAEHHASNNKNQWVTSDMASGLKRLRIRYPT